MDAINIEYIGCTITTHKASMDVCAIHQWLAEQSYWSRGIPLATVETAFSNSFCIGALHHGQQIAFGRLVTDYATFGYLADVYVLEQYRGQGIGKKMMEILFGLPWVKQLRGIKLQTANMHALYRQYGFAECKYPERIMEISRPAIYETNSNE